MDAPSRKVATGGVVRVWFMVVADWFVVALWKVAIGAGTVWNQRATSTSEMDSLVVTKVHKVDSDS